MIEKFTAMLSEWLTGKVGRPEIGACSSDSIQADNLSPKDKSVPNGDEASDQLFSKASVHVPTESKFQMGKAMAEMFDVAQQTVKFSANRFGLESGVAVVAAGYIEVLQKHLDIDAIDDLLRGLADTMESSSKYDLEGVDRLISFPTIGATSDQIRAFCAYSLTSSIERLGLSHGVSAIFSGFTRELRRKMTVAQAATLVTGLANSLRQSVPPGELHKKESNGK